MEVNSVVSLKKILSKIVNQIATNTSNIATNTSNISTLSCDYIVSTGATPGWTYRIWKSGRKEAWAQVTFSNISFEAAGNVYRSLEKTTNAPDIFNKVDFVYVTTPYSSVIIGCNFSVVNNTQIHGRFWKANGNTGTHEAQFYIIGS